MTPTLADNLESLSDRGYASLYRSATTMVAAAYLLLNPINAAAEGEKKEKECAYQMVCTDSQHGAAANTPAKKKAAVRKLTQSSPSPSSKSENHDHPEKSDINHRHPEYASQEHQHPEYDAKLSELEQDGKKNSKEHQDLRKSDKQLGGRTDTLERRVDLIQPNVSPRKIFMELYAGVGYSGVSRAEAGGAVVYAGHHATISLGAGVGLAGEVVTNTDLTQPLASETDNGYRVESSQTGTRTHGQRYLGKLSVGIARTRVRIKDSKFGLQPSASAVVEFSRDRETTKLTRTTQLYRAEEPVGDEVSASGSDTEYDLGLSLVPTAGLAVIRPLKDGRSIGLQLQMGYNIPDDRMVTGVLIKCRF